MVTKHRDSTMSAAEQEASKVLSGHTAQGGSIVAAGDGTTRFGAGVFFSITVGSGISRSKYRLLSPYHVQALVRHMALHCGASHETTPPVQTPLVCAMPLVASPTSKTCDEDLWRRRYVFALTRHFLVVILKRFSSFPFLYGISALRHSWGLLTMRYRPTGRPRARTTYQRGLGLKLRSTQQSELYHHRRTVMKKSTTLICRYQRKKSEYNPLVRLRLSRALEPHQSMLPLRHKRNIVNQRGR